MKKIKNLHDGLSVLLSNSHSDVSVEGNALCVVCPKMSAPKEQRLREQLEATGWSLYEQGDVKLWTFHVNEDT
jgi:hypothetical protein